MDYEVCSAVLKKFYQPKIKDVDNQHEKILVVWDEINQHIINMSVRQWHICPQACVKAKGNQFEQ